MRKERFVPKNDVQIPSDQRRGRGATSNASSRFDQLEYTAFDDGWDIPDDPAAFSVEWIADKSKSVLSYNKSPDVPFDRAVNPYRGCEHGCIYCYARPTHAYLGYSPGLDFETKLHYKPDVVERLRAELAKPSYRPQPIGFGTNTDPYQPGEKDKRLMRGLLELMIETQHPLTITTKGALINRDINLLSELAANNLVQVNISLTTLDNKLHRKLEPRAMSPKQRLRTIAALAAANIPTSVICAPLIPKLNDHELESMMEAAASAGAQSASYVTLRMPGEVSELFREWLIEHYPDRADKVIAHVQDLHEGSDYRSEFGARMFGSGVAAKLLAQRFKVARRQFGLTDRKLSLDLERFRKPSADQNQLQLDL